MFVLFGSGSNGKTTLLEAIRHVMGGYAGQVAVKTLMAKRGDSISNDIAQLQGRRFVTSSEVDSGQRLAEAQVKQLTGGGMLQARYLYQEYFEFLPTFKIFMDCNHKPEIRGTDSAIWRRMKLIPFKVEIPASEKDGTLGEKLKAEAPGILAWAVRGCLEWQRMGLEEPECVQKATGDYAEEMDVVA
jgi:putative DNA primase/helicase